MGATTHTSSHQWSDFDENRFPIPGRFDSLEKPQHLQSDMGVQNAICSPEQGSGNLNEDAVDSYFQDKYLSSEEDLSGAEDEDGNQEDYLSAYGDDDGEAMLDEADCVTREDIAKEILKSCRLAVAVSIIAAGRPKIVEMRQPSRPQRASLERSRQQRPAYQEAQRLRRQQQQQQQQQQPLQVTTPVQIPSTLPQTRNYSSMSSVNSPHRLSILSYFNSYSGSNSEQTETTKRSSLMSGFTRSNRSSTISTSSPSPDLSLSSSPPAPVLATGVLDNTESSKLAMTMSMATSPLMNVTSSPNIHQSQAVAVPSISATRNRLRSAFLSRLGSGTSGSLENRKHLWRSHGSSDASPTSVYSSSPSPSRSGGMGLWRPSTSQSQAQVAQQEHTSATGSSPACDTPFRLRLPSYITEGHEDDIVADDEGGDADSTTQQRPAKRPLFEFDR